MLERHYQATVISRLKRDFPGCLVIKMDPNYIQGFPDLLVLYNNRWAALEVKPSKDAPFQPNQEHYLNLLAVMSFAACICPENEEDVFNELRFALTTRR